MFERLSLLITMLIVAQAAAAAALPPFPELSQRYCHSVVAIDESDEPPADASFVCGSPPMGYEDRRLWLSAALPTQDFGAEATLLIHQTRFARLTVVFGYADGRQLRHQVSAGDFGSYWRVGGQLAFNAPRRSAPLVSLKLGIDRLASYPLLRTRLLPADAALRDAALAASLIGGALMLLALSSCYNFLLARASRQRFIIWHAAWVLAVLVWGLLWSQLALLAFPGLAGEMSSRLCTLLASLAIAFAATSAATYPAGNTVPRWSRRLIIALAGSVTLMGAAVAFGPSSLIESIGPVLGAAILGVLAAVTVFICLAWRWANRPARTFLLAWGVPMAVLAATQLFDMGTALFGGGPQIAVLLASAFQTVWLSVATTLRMTQLRTERDAARAAQEELRELAQRDPLTGLLNRRGFIDRAQRAIAAAKGDAGFSLLLIDVDHFKSINDRFGHDAGDVVLQRMANCLAQLAGASNPAARLGGEEFALGVSGYSRAALAEFADRVRVSLGDIALADLLGEEMVSVSIGVADPESGPGLQALYRCADQALYAAKNGGRNRVEFAAAGQTISSRARSRARLRNRVVNGPNPASFPDTSSELRS